MLDIRLLGSFQLTEDGRPIDTVKQSRQRSLLAYLLLHRGTNHSRQTIAFLFWPDILRAQAFANLRKALHRLRQALPNTEEFLEIDARMFHVENETTSINTKTDSKK